MLWLKFFWWCSTSSSCGWWTMIDGCCLGPVGGFFNYLKPPDLRGQPHPLRRFSPPKGRLKDIIQEQHGIAEDRQLLCYKGTLGGLDGAIFADLFQIRNCRTPSHGPNLAPFFLWNFRCNQPWSFQVRTRPKRFREGYLLFFPQFWQSPVENSSCDSSSHPCLRQQVS